MAISRRGSRATHAQYQTAAINGNAVAYAPPLVLQAGITARHPLGIGGSLRLRTISSRPANNSAHRMEFPPARRSSMRPHRPGRTATSSLTATPCWDLSLGYESARWSAGVIITNLTDAQIQGRADWSDRTDGERSASSAGGVLTPGIRWACWFKQRISSNILLWHHDK